MLTLTSNHKFITSHHASSHRSIVKLNASNTPQIDVFETFTTLSSFIAPDSLVKASVTPLGRGLVSTNSISKGDCLISIDWLNLLAITDDPRITQDSFTRRVLADGQRLHGQLPPELISFILRPDVQWATRLAAYLLYLRSNNTKSPIWNLYTQILPKASEMTCLMNYTPEQAIDFQFNRYIHLVQSEREQLLALHNEIFSKHTGLPELRSLDLTSFEDTLWAMCMVNSRCFSECLQNNEIVSLMVPCADFANHAMIPEAEYRYNQEDDAFQLIALRHIDPGEEVCISYGCVHKSSIDLMRDYGFVVQGNLNDRVDFSSNNTMNNNSTINSTIIDEKNRPTLHAGRFMHFLNVQGGVNAKTRSFEFTGASSPETLLSLRGKKGVEERRKIVALMSLGNGYLRNIPMESKGAIQGKEESRCSMSEEELQLERISVMKIIAQCEEMLSKLPTSIEEDEQELSSLFVVSNLGEQHERKEKESMLCGCEIERRTRKSAAIQARLEEKKVIASTRDILKQYRDSLQ